MTRDGGSRWLKMRRRALRALVMTSCACIGPLGLSAQGDGASLYTCSSDAHQETEALGLTLCDAAPTEELTARAAAANLQLREGALVLELEPDGVTDVAGFHAGDVIYRVGGVDVISAEAAAESLGRVGSRADTVVNFLRGGRPYRIKIRRE